MSTILQQRLAFAPWADPRTRRLPGTIPVTEAEWLLTDRGGILTRRGPEAREWFGAAHAPFDMRRLQRTHAALWEPALPASELRELRL